MLQYLQTIIGGTEPLLMSHSRLTPSETGGVFLHGRVKSKSTVYSVQGEGYA